MHFPGETYTVLMEVYVHFNGEIYVLSMKYMHFQGDI